MSGSHNRDANGRLADDDRCVVCASELDGYTRINSMHEAAERLFAPNDLSPPEVIIPPPPAGAKYDAGKRQWFMFPWAELGPVMDAVQYGATKYAPRPHDNWKSVEHGFERYVSAGFRHVLARLLGEKIDAESGVPHLACACCCFLFAIYHDTKEST